ncbi:MAG: hypothetical protein IPH83_13465 [Gammaproteobacteria bacterium]|jgi:hypothetical protein|nr:hypothetical protein [Gammaproteobacteria bacterium]
MSKQSGHEKSGRPAVTPLEYASPPCSRHEFDEADARYLNRVELLALLNELLEGERAGARGLIGMQRECSDPELDQLLHQVARDEARFCAMLGAHCVRLGAVPSRATGVFLDKLQARETLAEKFALLDRGQSAVVFRLDASIPRIADDALRADLVAMRAVHIENIERCARHAGIEPGVRRHSG